MDEVDRDHIRAAGHDGLNEDASNVFAVAAHDFERLGVVVFENQNAGLGGIRDTGRDGNGAQLPVSNQRPGEDFIEDPMIAARKHRDDIPPRNGAASADGGHEGFRSGIAESDAFLTAEFAD